MANAVVASGIPATKWCEHFDSVSVCFSKGLGAPVGSAICGTRKHIDHANRVRKVFGGGMRQAGIIAAGALYALENHIERMADDHRHARRFADLIRDVDGILVDPPRIETNIVYFYVDPKLGTAAEFAAVLKTRGLLVGALGKQQIRAVTHLDITSEQIERAGVILREAAAACAESRRPTVAAAGAYG